MPGNPEARGVAGLESGERTSIVLTSFLSRSQAELEPRPFPISSLVKDLVLAEQATYDPTQPALAVPQ